MALGYLEGFIEGVALVDDVGDPLKVSLQGASELTTPAMGSVQYAASFRPFFTILETGITGAKASIIFYFITPAKVAALQAAINAKFLAGQPFEVDVEDDLHDLNFMAWPNFEDHGRKWFDYPEQQTTPEYYEKVSLHFIVDDEAA